MLKASNGASQGSRSSYSFMAGWTPSDARFGLRRRIRLGALWVGVPGAPNTEKQVLLIYMRPQCRYYVYPMGVLVCLQGSLLRSESDIVLSRVLRNLSMSVRD